MTEEAKPEKPWMDGYRAGLSQARDEDAGEIRRLREALDQANRERDELTDAVLEWWNDANDGQVLPDFVLITLRLKGEIVP